MADQGTDPRRLSVQQAQSAADGSRGPVGHWGPAGGVCGSFPNGQVCILQGSHHSFVGRSDGDLGSDWEVIKPWTQQGKEREYLFPLFESWTKVIGIRENDLRISSDGEVFILSNPGPG